MAGCTRQSQKEDLIWVLKNILDADEDHAIYKACMQNGINSPQFLISLTLETVLLEYTEINLGTDVASTTSVTKTLNKVTDVPLLIAFGRYIKYLKRTGHPIVNNWRALDRDEFENFFYSDYNSDNPKPTPEELEAQQRRSRNNN